MNYLETELSKAVKCHTNGNTDEAEQLYANILKVDPDNIDVLHPYALLLAQKQQYESSINMLLKLIGILGINEKSLDILKLLEEVYTLSGNTVQSANVTGQILALEPSEEGYYNLGIFYEKNNQIENANICYLNAIAVNPNSIKSYIAIGNLFLTISDVEKAKEAFNKAINIDPNNTENASSYNYLGVIYKQLGDTEKFVHYLEQAYRLNPNAVACRYNLGCAYLTQKNFKEGWPLFEARLDGYPEQKPRFDTQKKPIWDGSQDIAGKTVYVYNATPYYAYGDTLMFARYIPLIVSKGAKVIFEPQPALVKLFQLCNMGAEIVESYTNFNFDYQMPVMSLANPFRELNDIPFSDKYITADDNKIKEYKEKFFNNDCLKVGLKWKGSPDVAPRNIDVDLLLKLSEVKNVKFYSLEKGLTEKLPDSSGVASIAETFNDFSDTAAAIANMDLVISVDTSIAHLVGAMGIPTWILLPYITNWRWFSDTETTPWYQSAKIFKQTERDNWIEVVERLKNTLLSL